MIKKKKINFLYIFIKIFIRYIFIFTNYKKTILLKKIFDFKYSIVRYKFITIYVRFVSLKHRSVILCNIVSINQYKFNAIIRLNIFIFIQTSGNFVVQISTPFQKSSPYNDVPPCCRKKCDDERKMKICFIFKVRTVSTCSSTCLYNAVQ